MASLLGTTHNTRYVSSYSKYIRSDLPANCTKDELDWLYTIGVRTVIDLRTEREYKKWQSSFENDKRFTLLHMPLTLRQGIDQTVEEAIETYKAMLDNKLTEVLNTMLSLKGKVLFFCYTGKDRTGVVSAMLQRRLGVGEAAIKVDYMRTANEMGWWLREFCKRNPEYKLDVCMPNLKYLQPVLDCPVY